MSRSMTDSTLATEAGDPERPRPAGDGERAGREPAVAGIVGAVGGRGRSGRGRSGRGRSGRVGSARVSRCCVRFADVGQMYF
eukprot:SAG31_NODE_364_length_16841_cov_7.005256_1_plen_82_part_00